MTLFEYVSNLTQNGTRIEMPRMLGYCKSERVGDKSNGIAKTYYGHELGQFEDELQSEKKRLEKAKGILLNITSTAINVTNSEDFYRKCFAYCPPDVRNGAYKPEKEKWDVLLKDIVLEVSNRLYETAYAERNFQGAKTLLTILQARLDAWQKKATATIEGNGEGGAITAVFNIT